MPYMVVRVHFRSNFDLDLRVSYWPISVHVNTHMFTEIPGRLACPSAITKLIIHYGHLMSEVVISDLS